MNPDISALFVDGEDIIDADYRLFYVHRGMENWQKPVWITTKLTSWLTVYVGFVGSHIVWPMLIPSKVLWGFKFQNALEWIRAILLEVERLHSHLLNLGPSSHFYRL